MFKPIRWQTFPRDFVVMEVGLGLFGLSIALMIRANLGTSAWAVLEVALANLLHITPGTMSVAMGFMVLGVAVALKERIGWGTLANILSIGLWEDLSLFLLPSVTNNLLVQGLMLLLAIVLMGLASAIYIGVDAGAGPRDSLMLAVTRTTRLSTQVARAIIEISVVCLGWLLGGPAGVGTVIFAFLIGPAVQWAFKLFNVQPHAPTPVVMPLPESQD